MRLRLSIVLAAAFLLGACTEAELEEFFGGMDLTGADLSSPDNPPDIQAVGALQEAERADAAAQAEIEQALDPEADLETRIAHADEAVGHRPHDPRYVLRRAVLHQLIGDTEAFKRDLSKALRILGDAHHTDDDNKDGDNEAWREWHKRFLDAIADVLFSYPPGSEQRTWLTEAYCVRLQRYRDDYGSRYLMASAYVDLIAHPELCEDW